MTMLKKSCVILFITVLTVVAIWVPTFASDDDWGYSFNLKTGSINSYSDGRYRQTTNTANQWKVNMKYHSRGETAKATYWLARTGDKERVSNIRTVTTKTGAVYTDAWAGASMVTVSLGAENYNDQLSATVSGYWDEETN